MSGLGVGLSLILETLLLAGDAVCLEKTEVLSLGILKKEVLTEGNCSVFFLMSPPFSEIPKGLGCVPKFIVSLVSLYFFANSTFLDLLKVC